MPNIVEFALKMTDYMSGTLRQAAQSGNTLSVSLGRAGQRTADIGHQFRAAETNVGNLTRRINDLRSQRDVLPVTALSQIRQFNSEINRLENQMNRMQTLNGSWFKSKFSQAMSSLPGAGFITNPIVAVGAGIATAVSKGMQNELQRTNITTLMGGDKAGSDALFGKITEYGKRTPYNKEGLIDSTRTMMSFGLSSEFAFGKLQQIGDIAMGDKNRMQSLSLAFAQATSTGKLMGQDFLQMINAGFNPLNVISERTGESIESLKDRMSKGQISANELAKSFEWATEKGGLFYQGAEKASQTLSGKISTMMDALGEMAISLYGAIEPILKPIVSFATTLFEIIGSGVEKMINGFKEGNPVLLAASAAIAGLTAGIGLFKIVTAIATIAQSGFTIAVWASNFALMANPIVWVTALVVGLVGGLVLLWKKSEGFRAAMYGMWEVMKGFGNILKEFVIDRIQGILSGLGSMGSAIAKLFKGDFKGAWKSANDGARDLLGIDAMGNALNSSRKLGEAFKQGTEKGRESFKKGKTEADKAKSDKSNSEIMASTAATAAGNTANASGTGSAMSNGGPKTITITIQKVLDNINIHATSFENGLDDVESKVLETMSRVLGQSVAQAL